MSMPFKVLLEHLLLGIPTRRHFTAMMETLGDHTRAMEIVSCVSTANFLIASRLPRLRFTAQELEI